MSKMRFARAVATSLPVLALALGHAAAQAQEASTPGDPQTVSADGPEESGLKTVRQDDGSIIVTAQRYVPQGSQSANKTDIPLIRTPQSVSVVTRDQIDLLNFIDAQQAVRYSSGVFGENYGPDLRYDFLTVRGFTPKQYIDGLAAPISTSIFSTGVDLYAFESIDILKGPASTLYGNVPPGGIFNETSRRASAEAGGELSAKYGSDDYKEVRGTITGPVADGLALRLTGLYRDRDAERDLVHANRQLIAPTATWTVDPATRVTLLGYFQRDRVKGDTNGFLPVFGTLLDNPLGKVKRSTNLGDPDNKYTRWQAAGGWDIAHDFAPNLKFRSNVKWNRYREETPRGIYGGGGLLDANFDGVPDDYRTVTRYNFTYKETVRSFTSDNRLDGSFETGALTHKVLAGVDYRNVSNKSAFGFFFDPAPIDLFDPVYAPVADPAVTYPFAFSNRRQKQTGLYGQDQIGLGNLYVTLGGRYDWVKTNDRSVVDADQKDRKFTWRAGANYVFDSGLAPYISYSRSFEPLLGSTATGEAFRPTTGRQWEGGVKYDARDLGEDVKLFVTAAAFDIKQRNFVVSNAGATPIDSIQGGEAEVYGGELEAVARIREQIALNASYTYTHSEITKDGTSGFAKGDPLPTTPKHKASLFANYTVQQGGLAGFGFGGGVRYTSRSAGGLRGAFSPVVYYGEAATLFDAIVSYDTPRWRFAVNGSNILDKRYVARCSGPAGCNFGAGRQVIATATAKF